MRKRALFRHVMLATSALVPLGMGIGAALANPLGPNVVGGNATVSGIGTSNVTIHQTTPRAVINWNTFNIGAGETTQFVQPSANSVALNRVTGGFGPSMIQGALTANGMVYLVNPEGVMISKSGVINTAGFLASTHDITNENFMAGRFQFNIPGRPSASIVNEGRINSHSHGFAALVAPGVRNNGTITATYGKVALASSGNGYALDLYGDKLISLAANDTVGSTVIDVATGQPLNSLVKNTGKLSANGGRVELTAAQARTVVDSVINNTGVIEARTVGTKNGKIVLGGSTTKVAGLPPQTVKVSGKLDVSAKGTKGKGGTVQVTGETIVVQAASFDASGPNGGGKILIGGDLAGGQGNSAVSSIPQAKLETGPIPNATSVEVDAATVINASATSVGNGGKVIVWADGDTTFAGQILARGGDTSGNGGFVEVSGKQTLSFTGRADLRAPNGSWGTLLLDPANLQILATGTTGVSGGTTGPFAPSVGTGSILGVDTLIAALEQGNVIIQTGAAGTGNGDINVDAGFTWGGPGLTADRSLTLSAYGNVNFGYGVVVTNEGAGTFRVQADNTGVGGTGVGRVTFFYYPSGPQIVSNGGGNVDVYFNPSALAPAFDASRVSVTGGGQLTAYRLIYSLSELQAINTSDSYALAKDITGGSFTGLTGTFTGNFDGLGNTISNLSVTGPSMFGSNAGTIKNLTVDGINIVASGNNQKIGVLVGENQSTGKIIDVTVSNSSVDGLAFTGVAAGLIAGQNLGLISNGYAQGSVTVGDGVLASWNFAGGLAGINTGTINNGSNADVTVLAASHAYVGGLVGLNGNLMSAPAVIENSSAEGTVTATGYNVAVGGLVGFNAPGAKVYDSNAVGNVTASYSIPPANTGPNCMPNCMMVVAGGLVGENQGEITSVQSTYMTFAQGDVSVGSNAIGGGFVGINNGIITYALAAGDVTGLAGTPLSANDFDTFTALGGFAGVNRGLISDSIAGGGVGTVGIERLEIGGFVAHNSGTINTSYAVGTHVSAGSYSQAGGFAGSGDECVSCAPPSTDGAAYYNTNTIANSSAATAVTVGDSSLAGGFIGSGSTILNSHAIGGSVIGGMNSVLGGFVGAHNIGGQIYASTATYMTVNANGPFTWVGGFVGYNGGTISDSDVIGGMLTANSYSTVGGFAAVNIGLIDQNSSTYGHFINAQNSNVVGAFTGANFGKLDTINVVNADVTVGSNNVFGTVVGANAHFTHFTNEFVPPQIPSSTSPTGTFASVQTTGNYHETGTGNSTGLAFVGQQYPSQLPYYPSIIAGCTDPMCGIFNYGVLGAPPGYGHDYQPQVPGNVIQPPQIHQALQDRTDPPPQNLIQLANLNANPPGGGPGTSRWTVNPQNTPGLNPASLAPALPQRPTCGVGGNCTSFASLLPPGQFIADQVVVQIPQNISQQNVQQILAQMGLTVLGSQPLTNGNNALNLQLPPGMTMRDVITRLEQNQVVASAHANMKYTITQHVPAAIAPFTESRGDPAQYTMGKLQLGEAHQVASGNNIIVAVIDSEVDVEHAELKRTGTQKFDATDTQPRAHSHGTAMAGAIVSRERLLGVAPGARILAIRAFSETQVTAESTTFTILKSIEHAVSQGARVINMSFAGPYDPSLEKALKDAAGKGVVLIGASGNAGPKSLPLWPGADPHVIAVTATDSGDKGFRQANRGPYVSVAAPGVEILAPAPDSAYQLSTGTSIATAHVSGVVALMLERDPTLTPADVRLILESTASDLGPRGRDQQFGWGLVNPARALAMVEQRKRSKGTSQAPKPVQR